MASDENEVRAENGEQIDVQWPSSEDVAEASDGGVRSGVIDLIASTSFS